MNERETESDEDCEVYFLKPVNEYNIVDKIKEANKELFADTEPDKSDIDVTAIRKVTFALNLEDYEPIAKATTTSTIKIKDEVMINNTLEVKLKTTEVECFTIEEEEEAEASVEEELVETEIKETDHVIVQPKTELAAEEQMTEADMETTDLEYIPDEEIDTEILEDILIMDAEESVTKDMTTSPIASVPVVQKSFVKQTTFDYDEQDKKSLTNLFIYENESDDAKQSTENIADNKEEEQDDDDDDDLSIIVASYLPDNFDIYDRDFETSNIQESTFTKSSSSASLNDNNKTLKQHMAPSTSTLSFFNSKSFSFRRTNSNSAAANLFEKQQPQHTQLHVPELKFNYKTCCEFRNAIQDNLPKYTGYLSEYGLSREQLLQREQQLKRKKRSVLEQSLKTNEDELRKMQDNERAFTTWLKNKMRYPINKTRNMFDVKIRRNSVVATNATTQMANCNKHGCMHSAFK